MLKGKEGNGGRAEMVVLRTFRNYWSLIGLPNHMLPLSVLIKPLFGLIGRN
jgi:hypothetical protein